MRLIPGKTKVKMELFKGITLVDVLIVLAGLGIAALCAVSSLPYRWVFALIVMGIFGDSDEMATSDLLEALASKLSLPSQAQAMSWIAQLNSAAGEEIVEVDGPDAFLNT